MTVWLYFKMVYMPAVNGHVRIGKSYVTSRFDVFFFCLSLHGTHPLTCIGIKQKNLTLQFFLFWFSFTLILSSANEHVVLLFLFLFFFFSPQTIANNHTYTYTPTFIPMPLKLLSRMSKFFESAVEVESM